MILITGANGFIGSYLTESLHRSGLDVCATGRGAGRLPAVQEGKSWNYRELDFTDPFAVHDIIEDLNPSVIVHCGAMGKPDECEQQQWLAWQTNTEATLALAQHAVERKAYLLFVSTDFVFDGQEGFYAEEAPLNPVNFYGRTKVEAEEAVTQLADNWGIVRTVLVYGAPRTGRSNLLSILQQKLQRGESYRVVNDQFRTPTYVEDLVEGMRVMIEKRSQGIFHLSGEEAMTPYDMAIRAAKYWQLPTSLVEPVSTAALQHPAARPVRTGLQIEKAKSLLGFRPRTLEEGLQAIATVRAQFGE